MTIQIVPSPVVPPRRPRVGMSCSVLDISEERAGVEAENHERVSEVVR